MTTANDPAASAAVSVPTGLGAVLQALPGRAFPLGAHFDGLGTNFSLFTEIAERVELCLLSDRGETRTDLSERDGHVWHGYVPNAGPGQRYGYRVHGPYAPAQGHRCNPAKLLLDPYARAIDGDVRWDEAVYGYHLGHPDERNDSDSAPFMPRSVVINPFFDWAGDRPLRRPYHETVIYEAHLRGMTMLHDSIPKPVRGTYSALAHPAVVAHLSQLGVTAVELMPVHQFVHDQTLVQRGLRNYWGYNTIGFFAPHNGYAAAGTAGQQVMEFKAMVRALHQAGIEVILDVVYNHTAEGNHLGPTLSFRGIDNAAYYRLVDSDRCFYYDTTGTGNTLLMREPYVLQLIMDSLRYWATEMHVDGFRFDLAASLARQFHEVDRLSAFFDLVQQDPVISSLKLIAEPWDLGDGGYQVGNFPPLWSEWNGRYRDTARDYWRGEPAKIGEFASRLTGSSDLYASSGRRPYASVNFVTAHDGFTLRDLVTYNTKHNEANGEDNRDGTDDNRSWNSGIEGPTDDPAVLAMRGRRARDFLTTLLLSQGVPMLLHGDEIGRSQRGNNNAYCQDNEIAWMDWHHADTELFAFACQLVRVRREHPVFRRKKFFQGRPVRGTNLEDIAWLTPSGQEMSDEDWTNGFAKSLTVFLNGDGIPEVGAWGQRLLDDSYLLFFNGHGGSLTFTVPDARFGRSWTVEVSTEADSGPHPALARRRWHPNDEMTVPAHVVTILRRVNEMAPGSAGSLSDP